MSCLLGFELGLTAATRTNLRYQRIPDPDSWTYLPYSSVKKAGDGQMKAFGFPTFTWTWNTLSQREVDAILGYFGAAVPSVTAHVTTYLDTGGSGPPTTTTGTAIMDRPVDGSGKTMVDESRLPSYNNVTLTFRHYVAS